MILIYYTRRLLSLTLAFLLGISLLQADVVETKNGARIVGQVTKIEDGKIFVTTDYAGDLVIKQSEVVGMSADICASRQWHNAARHGRQ